MKYKSQSFHRNKILAFILIVILAFLILKALAAIPVMDKSHETHYDITSIEYLEDKTGNLTLEEILSEEYDDRFVQELGSSLPIGQSRSAWWIRIDAGFLSAESEAKYLSINNPTVEHVVLYLPRSFSGESVYDSLESGWGTVGAKKDEGYLYPVFKLEASEAVEHDLYLRLNSPFTQNYSIGIMSHTEYDRTKLENLFVLGVFFGLLLAMGISNLLNFLSFKGNVQLYYVIYLLSMLIYHGALLGLFRIYMGRSADALIGNVVALGLFMVAAAVIFFRAFLSTESNYPKQHKITTWVLLLSVAGILLTGAGLKYEASVLSILPAAAAILVIVYTSFSAMRSGIRGAKFFLAGWCAMLFSFIIFTVRVWGLLPNNDLTQRVVLVSAAIEAILLSVALADRVKVLRNEKEQALLLFRNAEEESLSNESAFLQAQIKPHFLYNALNVIAALCRIDAEKARMLILDFSSYLHHSFDFRNQSKYISFDEELEFVKAYVRIEQARFHDKLKVEYELDDTCELQIPPLMLQPLIENAIRHGVRKSDRDGTVWLRVKKLETEYIVEVEDDGAGMPAEQIVLALSEKGPAGSGVGLTNIKKRLRMIYGTQLKIESAVGKGTKITMVLPKRKDTV